MQKNFFSILLLSGSGFLVGGLSYAYQFGMIRLLSISDYADFAAMLAIINIATLFMGSFSFFLVKEIVKKEKNLYEIITVIKEYTRYEAFIIFILFLLLIPTLKQYLKIEDSFIFLITAIIILFSGLGLYQRAFFQGQKYFQSIAMYQTANPILKITSGIGLIVLGSGAIGGIAGIGISLIILVGAREIHIKYLLKNKSKNNSKIIQAEFISDINSKKKQILEYLTFSIIIGLLTNIDIIVAKNLVDAESAGVYAAISVLAKFLLFLGISIETVYYPQLVKKEVFPTQQILKISLYYIALLIGSIAVFFLFGDMILRLFKDGLQDYTSIIFPMLIYSGILGYVGLIVKTLIAFEKYFINYILSVVIMLMVGIVYIYAHDIYSLAYIFMIGVLVALISSVGSMLMVKNKSE